MPEFSDQLGNIVSIPRNPQRIISLVPSITEFLYALGLGDRVVAITKFCIYPDEWYISKPRIGGTKTPDIDKIRAIKPDLIIGNKEENRQEDIAALGEFASVWMSDVNSIQDMYSMLTSLGEILGLAEESLGWITRWKTYFEENKNKGQGKKALYFIWKDPEMVVGKGTYIDAYMKAIGYANCVEMGRYPMLSDLDELNHDVVLLSTEPFPFKETDFGYFQERFPKARIELVSGEEFSWYGVRNVI
jgi:ABC-type Fe3+-hydroxamate transport system substrate-binding protein